MSSRACELSIVLPTYNRRDVVLATLHRLYGLGDEVRGAEIIVVDNASTDGTAGAIAQRFPAACMPLKQNLGACAKALAADIARGELVVFLDDDSYPRPGTLTAMRAHLDRDPKLGAVSCHAHLPDGRRECCAFPNVFIGCGVGFRRTALAAAGGLDRTLFMQAEEYDLSFRLIHAGFDVRTCDDLHVEHLKSPTARTSRRAVFFDTRNNLWLTARYLPDDLSAIYWADWRQRYGWLARRGGHRWSWWRGALAARLDYRNQRMRFMAQRLSPTAIEKLFHLKYVERAMQALYDSGVRRILLADLGKNIHAFTRGAERAGLAITAIADDHFTAPGRTYRGLAIVPFELGLRQEFDAIVIANTSPEQARRTQQRLRAATDVPVHRWFDYTIPPVDADTSGPAATNGRPARQRISPHTGSIIQMPNSGCTGRV
jgi:GT2 family glycosyltransferase